MGLCNRLLILYASQTGYAQETAERIEREAKQRHFDVELKSMDTFDISRLPLERLVCFVCSVTGQGEEPDTMKSFWKYLLKKSIPKILTELHFGVFGQGDSSYQKFNFPAKKLHRRLLQLGGTAIVERGDGDDQHYLGVDGALDPWLEQWWRAALKLYPIPDGLEVIPSTIIPASTFEITMQKSSGEFIAKGSHFAVVKENSRITSKDHFQDVRFFDFQVSPDCDYVPGDCMQLYPRNNPEKVQEVLDTLGWSDIADDPILFESTSKNIPALYSQPISLRTLFERHLDIFGRPRRYFFQLLSFFATNEQHAEKLVEFGTTEGQTDLYAYAHKPRRTIFEVLQDFTSVKIPIKYLPDLIPPMRPRQFSISSCKQVHGDSIHLAVAIVHYKSSLQEPRVGVCTDWMKTLRSGGTFISLDLVDFDIQKGTFKLPNPLYPIICIGPGTGIAPMRSLLYHHFTYSAQPSCLLFGGRNVDADYYFEKEWKKASELYPFKVITAFSRDQEDKIYVQHRIVEHGAYLWNLIEQGAVIYLSGYFKLTRNAKRMPVDVQEAFVQVFIKHGHLSQDQANEFIKTLKNSNRFQEECWS